MSRTNTRIALAAVLAALSLPTLADEAPGFPGDPTWPAIEQPAPAAVARAQGGEADALLRADPTWPATDSAAPAIALALHAADGPQVEPPADWAPRAHYAIDLAPKADRIAAAR